MPPRRYTYSERAGDYGIAGNRGRLVSRREIRQAVDGALERGQQAVQSLTDRLQRREITVAEWQLAMAREIRSATMVGLASAHGGFDRLSPAKYGRAGAHLREQYRYLRRWAAEIERDRALDGRALRRAAMYIESARQHHEREVGADRQARGYDEVRSIRNARDSCTTTDGVIGCIEMEGRGYVPAAEYVYPGRRPCRSACKCYSEWKRSSDGAIAA